MKVQRNGGAISTEKLDHGTYRKLVHLDISQLISQDMFLGYKLDTSSIYVSVRKRKPKRPKEDTIRAQPASNLPDQTEVLPSSPKTDLERND